MIFILARTSKMDYWTILGWIIVVICVVYAIKIILFLFEMIKWYKEDCKDVRNVSTFLRQNKINTSIIINHKGRRYLWPKDMQNGWFVKISSNKLIYSLTEQRAVPEWIDEVEEIIVDDLFFEKNIKHLLFETRNYNFFRWNFY